MEPPFISTSVVYRRRVPQKSEKMFWLLSLDLFVLCFIRSNTSTKQPSGISWNT
ncbi:hypothetical protein C5167_036227 [Papaver somniferum]|nr:hypothetical protein C5167_036227 [Papaver somniferum]